MFYRATPILYSDFRLHIPVLASLAFRISLSSKLKTWIICDLTQIPSLRSSPRSSRSALRRLIRQHPQSCTCLFVSNTALLSTSFSPPFLSQAPATGLSSHARSLAMNDPAVTIASLGAYSNSPHPNLANDGSIQDVWLLNEHLSRRPNKRSSCRPSLVSTI